MQAASIVSLVGLKLLEINVHIGWQLSVINYHLLGLELSYNCCYIALYCIVFAARTEP